MLGREHYYLTGTNEETEGAALSAFIKQMYAGTPYIPKEIWLEQEVEDADAILEWLSAKRGHKVYFRYPQRGQKERMLELAKKNARMVLQKDAEKLQRERARTKGRWKKSRDCLVFPDSAVWNRMISQISMVLRRLVQWLCLKRERRKRMITASFVSVP